ncbi:RluA family pseudouridine synthase [Ligilactobacillus equi]
MWIIQEKSPADLELKVLLKDQWRLPKRYIYGLSKQQNVLLDGHYHHLKTLVRKGTMVSLKFTGQEFRSLQYYLPDSSQRLEILFENRDLVVINKPAGIKSHPNQAQELGTVMNYLSAQLGQVYMVHRLDQETSGAMLVAKNPVVVPVLNQLIAQGAIKRRYLAIVHGHFTQTQGFFDQPIGLNPQNPNLRAINGLQAQSARSYYRVLDQNTAYSLVYLTLETGRTHQLRVHLQASGHPIVGDPLYGQDQAKHLLLHGLQQKLVLPFSFTTETIVAPPPAYFTTYFPNLNQLNLTELLYQSGHKD